MSGTVYKLHVFNTFGDNVPVINKFDPLSNIKSFLSSCTDSFIFIDMYELFNNLTTTNILDDY